MSVTCGRMADVFCGGLPPIHETDFWGVVGGGGVGGSVSYMRQVGGRMQRGVCTLSVTLGRLADVRGVCVNYISYFGKIGGCLQEVCNLVVI